MVTGGISVGSWGWALVDDVRDNSFKNTVELANRSSNVSLIPEIAHTVDKNESNIFIICKGLDLDCIED